MSKRNTSRKPTYLQPATPKPSPYDVAMRKLGLDSHSIDLLASEYRIESGDDSGLVLTIVLLRRLLALIAMRNEAPELPDNYLALLIDRLYRATDHCDNEASQFAKEADQALRAKSRPMLVSERRAS